MELQVALFGKGNYGQILDSVHPLWVDAVFAEEPTVESRMGSYITKRFPKLCLLKALDHIGWLPLYVWDDCHSLGWSKSAATSSRESWRYVGRPLPPVVSGKVTSKYSSS